jgi:hypothetical protein
MSKQKPLKSQRGKFKKRKKDMFYLYALKWKHKCICLRIINIIWINIDTQFIERKNIPKITQNLSNEMALWYISSQSCMFFYWLVCSSVDGPQGLHMLGKHSPPNYILSPLTSLLCTIYIFWYWSLNSGPSPWASPPALFLC